MTKPHPIQPLEKVDGVLRFKSNAIVEFLVENYNLNRLAREHDFSREDWTQLAQLIGYSAYGAVDLSYVDPVVIMTALDMLERGSNESDSRIAALEQQLKEARSVAKRARELLEEIGDD